MNNSIGLPQKRFTLTDAIKRFTKAEAADHEVLHRRRDQGQGPETVHVAREFKEQMPHALATEEVRSSRREGRPTLYELIRNEYDEGMPDRVFDSMNRSHDWYGKEGARVGDLKTAKNKADAFQVWDGWLKENGSAYFNDCLKAACQSKGVTDENTIKILEELARQQIENAQRSLPVTTTRAVWEDTVQHAIRKVVRTPDIDLLIAQFDSAGEHRHLHYSEEKNLFTRDPAKARKEDSKPNVLGSFLPTASWKAFLRSKDMAVERVCISIDRKYGAGMSERVLDAMRQQHGWKRHHGVEVSDLQKMNDIGQALSRFDESKKDHDQWIAQACIACGVDVADFRKGGQERVLQDQIRRILNRLPTDADRGNVQRAVQVAVLHMIALPRGIWIDGYSLFLQGGAFRNVEIGDAYRALVAISERAPRVNGTSHLKMRVEAFARAVWMEEVCRSCGIDRTSHDWDWDQVRDAIDAAVRSLPDDAPPERKKRAAHGAILRMACKSISPKLRINDDREGYKALMRSLFRDEAGSHYRDDIRSVYATFKLLAGQPVNEASYRKAWDVQAWMQLNYDRTHSKVALQCGLPADSLEGEKVWQSVGILVAAKADLRLADEFMAQRAPLLGEKRAEETDEEYSKRLEDADALRDKATANRAAQFERAAEIALLHQAESSPLWTPLVNWDGEHRELPVGVIHRALGKVVGELNAVSFAAATEDVVAEQDAWQDTWLDDNLDAVINRVIKQCDIDVDNLSGGKGRTAVKDALGWLPPGASPDQVAEGALIAQDLLARVLKARQRNVPPTEGYSPPEQLQFEQVVQSLILPDGSNYGRNLALAHKVLRPKAEQGTGVTLATFDRAWQEHEVTLMPLADRLKAVRTWIRHEGAANVELASPDPHYLGKEEAKMFIRGQGDHAWPALAAIHGVSEPFFARPFAKTVRILTDAHEANEQALPGTSAGFDPRPNASEASTAKTIAIFNRVMNLFIGDPDAVPEELCAFFATAYAEVDGARIDPGLKPDEALAIRQKMRDDVDTALALRTIAPLFLRAVAADKAGSTELGIPQLAEMIQKVANTKADLPDAKFHKDVQTAINAWRDEYKRFARQVRERGQPYLEPGNAPPGDVGDAGSDDESGQRIEFSPPHSRRSSVRLLDPDSEGERPNDESVTADPDNSLKVVSPFARGRNAWVKDNLSAVLKEARQVCGDAAFPIEAMPGGVVYLTIGGLPDTTTQKQAMRAAVGALIERDLLDLMARAEKQGGSGRNQDKRTDLRNAIESVFHPNKPYNGLSVGAAYKALAFSATRVDEPFNLDEVRRMAAEFDRTGRSDDAPPFGLVPDDRHSLWVVDYAEDAVKQVEQDCEIRLDPDVASLTILEEFPHQLEGVNEYQMKRAAAGALITQHLVESFPGQSDTEGFEAVTRSLFYPDQPPNTTSLATAYKALFHLLKEKILIDTDTFQEAVAQIDPPQARQITVEDFELIKTAPGMPDRVENGVDIPGDTYLTFDTSESDSEESDRVPSPTEQVQPRPVENDATSAMQGPIESPIARVPRACGLESLSFSDAVAQRAIRTAEEGLSKDASTKLRARTVDVALIRLELVTRLQKSGKFLLPEGVDSVIKTMREPDQAHYDTDLGKAFRTLWELLDNDKDITVESFESALNRIEASEARDLPPPLLKAKPMPEGLVMRDLRHQAWVTDENCQKAIDTVCRQCDLPRPTMEQAREAIDLGLSWLRDDPTEDEMERAAQIGLIRQALTFPHMSRKALEAHDNVLHSLVNPDNKFYKFKLATVDEALRNLHESGTAVNSKSFLAAVNKINKRDRIVDQSALACGINLKTIDTKELNKTINSSMDKPDVSPEDLAREIRGHLIQRYVAAWMARARLQMDDKSVKDLKDLMDSLFTPKGGLRHEVGYVQAYKILRNLVTKRMEDDRQEVTVMEFSNQLARVKARQLKPAQKVEAARVWVEYEVKAIQAAVGEGAGATAQPANAAKSFMSDSEDMGMPARIGRAAFREVGAAHFVQPIQKALEIVTQGEKTAEEFGRAMAELLKTANDSQGFQALANLVRSARSKIDNAPQELRDAFDRGILHQVVIPEFEAAAAIPQFEAAAANLPPESVQAKRATEFRDLLLTVATLPNPDVERQYPDDVKKLITAARAAYKKFVVDSVVARGGYESELRKVWLQANSQAIIDRALKDSPELAVLASTMAEVMRPAVMALPPGSSPEDMEHAARGALIQLDVFNRVMKARKKWKERANGYDQQELKRFDKVAHSLFNPLGKHRDVRLETAQRVLRSLADLGKEIRIEDFVNAMAADKAMRSPLKEKEASVRAWIRHHVGAGGKEGLSQSDIQEFLRTDSTMPGNVDIPGRAALRGVGGFGPLVQQAVRILQWPPAFNLTSKNKNSVTETVRKFNAVMMLLLLDVPVEANPDIIPDIKPSMDRALAKVPEDFYKLYAVARSELDKAQFASGVDPHKHRVLLQREFDTSIFLGILKPLFEEAIAKDSFNLRGSGVDSFVELLEQVCSEEVASQEEYPPEIRVALDAWRANYRTFTGKLAARAIAQLPKA